MPTDTILYANFKDVTLILTKNIRFNNNIFCKYCSSSVLSDSRYRSHRKVQLDIIPGGVFFNLLLIASSDLRSEHAAQGLSKFILTSPRTDSQVQNLWKTCFAVQYS